MKAAIIIYSKTGHTEEMAEIIRSQLEKEGVEARIFNIENAGIDYEYMKGAEGIITGSPTYLSSAHWRMMKFLSEDSVSLSLSGKLAAVFATAHYAQGGADGALMEMIGSLLVRGCLLYSSGSAEGLPSYITDRLHWTGKRDATKGAKKHSLSSHPALQER